MKKNVLIRSAAGLLFAAAISLTACKSKTTETTTTDTATVQPQETAPVVVAPDDALTTGLKDATKDYPGVTATTIDGEITLTGTIKRSELPKLMQSIQALNPKKVNNNLTIQ